MEKNYDFRKKLLQVHKPNCRNPERKPEKNEFWLQDGAVIGITSEAGLVLQTAAADFVDFLKISMNLSARVVTDSQATVMVRVAETEADKKILGDMQTYKGFVYTADEKGIEIIANDDRGGAQALYYLEDMMYFAMAPAVSYGTVRKKPLYAPMMIHSGYGLDEYPDAYLARVAHEGRDAILVFTKGVNETPTGYLDFNDLIRRAAKYGLDVYAYSKLISEMHPDEPGAEAYYDSTYGRLFRECPGLKGVTLVGESVEFPSKDPHVSPGRLKRTAVDGIPTGKLTAGWYPCEDYPLWLSMITKVIRKYNKEADVVFWTYNWGFQPEDIRIKLIESLPQNISLQATYEMFEPMVYGETAGRCEDYTLSFAGPGDYFRSEAEAAKKRGIRLYAMTNTGGLTWDMGVIPYEPMPQQWMRRYATMEEAHEKWGLCGLMETHHYGFYPSIISKLSKHVFLEPHEPAEEILKKVIGAEFGVGNTETVEQALDCFSHAIRHFTPSDADQYGAFRVGPSYPFNLSEELVLPSDEGAMFGNRICAMHYHNGSDYRMSHLSLRIHEELTQMEKMWGYMSEGVSLLEGVKNPNEALCDLLNLGRFIRNTVLTGMHAKKWYLLKCRMHVADTREALTVVLDEMEALLKSEIKNAEDTIPLVEKDSRLGWEPSMLYMTDRWHIEWKIRQVRYVLESDLANHRRSLAV